MRTIRTYALGMLLTLFVYVSAWVIVGSERIFSGPLVPILLGVATFAVCVSALIFVNRRDEAKVFLPLTNDDHRISK